MGLDLDYGDGQTPLDEDEKKGLLITTITTRGELDELKKLLDDCKYWIDNKVFIEDEVAVRFSHRIVTIHPFANGNGRHSRLIADILINHGLGQPHFAWGSINLTKKGAARSAYLKALHDADENDY